MRLAVLNMLARMVVRPTKLRPPCLECPVVVLPVVRTLAEAMAMLYVAGFVGAFAGVGKGFWVWGGGEWCEVECAVDVRWVGLLPRGREGVEPCPVGVGG